MSEKTLEDQLKNLRCHFTWNLQDKEGYDISKTETLSDQMEFPHAYNRYMLYNWKAYTKYVQGDYTEAMARLSEAEELCLSNSNQSPAKLLVIYGNYAWLYYILKEHETAQLYVEKVESIYQELKQSTDPKLFNCPEIDGEQGWTLLMYSVLYYEQAKECFEKALKSAPEDPDWNTGYAMTIYRLESFQDGKYPDHHSLDLLKRATELNPKDTVVKTLLGLKLQALDREDEGLKYIEEALEQTPDLPSCLRYAAKFYRKARMIDEALYLLTKALGLQPKSAFLHHQIGLCHRSKFFAAKKSEHPDNPRQEEINEHIEKAIGHFELTLECDKSFRGVYADLANMYKEIEEYQKAEELFKTVLSFKSLRGDERQVNLYQYGSFLWYCKKSEKEAINLYKQVLLIPGSCSESKKCESILEKMAKRKLRDQWRDPMALGLLGLVYKVQGNIPSAIEYYEKALAYDPSKEEYSTALRELKTKP